MQFLLEAPWLYVLAPAETEGVTTALNLWTFSDIPDGKAS